MRQLSFILLFVLLVISVQAVARDSSRVDVPGTGISIIPPEGFTRAERFAGFLRESANSSIMVTEIPAPCSKLASGFTKEALAEKGMILISSSDCTIDGRKGILLSVRQEARGETFLKWILVAGDETLTATIVATFPECLKEDLSDSLKAALQSARFSEKKSSDPWEGMTFRVKEAGDLKRATRLGNNILLTREGKFPAASPEDPVLLVGASISQNMPIEKRKDFAIGRLSAVEEVKDVSVEKVQEVTIDDLNGYEIVGAGKDRKSGAALLVYETILFEERDYYIIFGYAGLDRRSTWLKIFREVSQSFKRTGQDKPGSEKISLPITESRFLSGLAYPGSQDVTDREIASLNYQGKNSDTVKASGYKLPIAWNRMWIFKTSDPVSRVLAFYKEKLPGASLDYTEKLGEISIDSYIRENTGSCIIKLTPPDSKPFSKDAQTNGRCVYPAENFTLFIERAEDGATEITMDEWVLVE